MSIAFNRQGVLRELRRLQEEIDELSSSVGSGDDTYVIGVDEGWEWGPGWSPYDGSSQAVVLVRPQQVFVRANAKFTGSYSGARNAPIIVFPAGIMPSSYDSAIAGANTDDAHYRSGPSEVYSYPDNQADVDYPAGLYFSNFRGAVSDLAGTVYGYPWSLTEITHLKVYVNHWFMRRDEGLE